MSSIFRAPKATTPPPIDTAASEQTAAMDAQRQAQKRVKTSIVLDTAATPNAGVKAKKQLLGG